MDMNKCHRTLFGLRMFSACKMSFFFLMFYGGTGCVGYMLKEKGKKVTCNDILRFNWYICLALIENGKIKLTDNDVDLLLIKHSEIKYPTFVYNTFKNIYFTDEENQWIDMVVTNIRLLLIGK